MKNRLGTLALLLISLTACEDDRLPLSERPTPESKPTIAPIPGGPLVDDPSIPPSPKGTSGAPTYPDLSTHEMPPHRRYGHPVFPPKKQDDLLIFEGGGNIGANLEACRKTKKPCLTFYFLPQSLHLSTFLKNAPMLYSSAWKSRERGRVNARFRSGSEYNIQLDDSKFSEITQSLQAQLARQYQLEAEQIRIYPLSTTGLQVIAEKPLANVQKLDSKEILAIIKSMFSTSVIKFGGEDLSGYGRIFRIYGRAWDIEPAFRKAILSDGKTSTKSLHLVFHSKAIFRPSADMTCHAKNLSEWLRKVSISSSKIRFRDFSSKFIFDQSRWNALKIKTDLSEFCEGKNLGDDLTQLCLDACLSTFEESGPTEDSVTISNQRDYLANYSSIVPLNTSGVALENLKATAEFCERHEKPIEQNDTHSCESACDERTEFYFPEHPGSDSNGCIPIEEFDIQKLPVD